ncbi:hypothetical protein [Undibacterium curvum]|uniref:Uncharacterized protein n=1 Tax=Undibacterium curvum TaxID=2762294 RepID=A0ABR7A0C3_9BURK|nr:hypothetical protein [Undibacterium curvum]MBC3930364.1 hypothetical protein [Undibacterium curvum]
MNIRLVGYAVAGIAVIGVAYYAYQRVTGIAGDVIDTAGEALNAINPLNDDNVINTGAIDLYQKVTGSKGTIGTDLYDWLHPDMSGLGTNIAGQPGYDPFKAETDKKGNVVAPAVGDWRGSKL